MYSAASTRAGITELAGAHGLTLDKSSVRINEMGLDFRVAFARSLDGKEWVLRMPRRADVLDRMQPEAGLLELIAPLLDVAVPRWQIHTPELIAYPLLPGEPALELDKDMQPQWLVKPTSLIYARSLGQLLAQLHRIDPEQARGTGIDAFDPDQLREHWRGKIKVVQAEFPVASALLERWNFWLAEDSYWPDRTVVTHGEIYPGHTLVEGEEISAVLDWTTAAVHDPAVDFMYQQSIAPRECFDLTVATYVEHGGRVWPRIAEHCAHMFSTAPVGYAIFALLTEEQDHLHTAATLLNPPQK